MNVPSDPIHSTSENSSSSSFTPRKDRPREFCRRISFRPEPSDADRTSLKSLLGHLASPDDDDDETTGRRLPVRGTGEQTGRKGGKKGQRLTSGLCLFGAAKLDVEACPAAVAADASAFPLRLSAASSSSFDGPLPLVVVFSVELALALASLLSLEVEAEVDGAVVVAAVAGAVDDEAMSAVEERVGDVANSRCEEGVDD